MDYVIVFLLGVAMTIVPAALWASSKLRPAAATPASPAQPPAPVIVLQSAPQPQPITNNYTYNDNRRVVMDQAPAYQPLVTEQLSLAQYQPQRTRRYKVVGEREEWQPSEHNGWLPPGHSGMQD